MEEEGQTTTRSPGPGVGVQQRLKGVPGVRTISIRSIEDAGQYTCKATFEDTQQIFTKNTEVDRRRPIDDSTANLMFIGPYQNGTYHADQYKSAPPVANVRGPALDSKART